MIMVVEILFGFLDVAFLPPWASFPMHFFKFVVEVKSSGPPHVLQLWLGVGKGMLLVKYVRSNTAFLCL